MRTLKSEISHYESKFQIRFKTLLYLSDLSKLPNSSALHSCNACDAQMNEVCEMAILQIFSFV